MAEIIDVRLPLDAINSQLNQLDQRFKKTENEAGKVGDKLGKGMDGAARSTKKVDTEQQKVTKNLKAQDKEAGKLNKTMRGLAPVITAAFAAQQLVRFTKEISRMAIEIQQLDQKARIVFGDSLPRVTRESEKAANAIGLTAREFRSAAAGVADVLGPLGFTRDQAAKTAVEVTKLAGAISNWSGGQFTAAEATKILQQSLVGQTKGLRTVGLIIDQTSPQYRLRIKEIMETEKVTLEQAKAMDILAQITQKSEDAQIAFAGGAENMAVQLGKANAQAREASEAFALVITPALIGLTNAYATSIKTIGDVASRAETPLGVFLTLINPLAWFSAVRGAQKYAEVLESILSPTEDAAEEIAKLNDELRKQLGLTEEQVTVERGLIEVLLEKKKLLDDQIKGATSQAEINRLLTEQEAIEKRINDLLNNRPVPVEPEVFQSITDLDAAWDAAMNSMTESGKGFVAQFEEDFDKMVFDQVEANEKEKNDKKKLEDFKRDQDQATMDAGIDLAYAGADAAAAIFGEQSQAAKAFAVFAATLDAFAAINSVLSDPLLPTLVKIPLAASIGIRAFANIAKIKSTALPSFYTGTEYLKLGNNPKGRDTIPVMAHEGEAIIRTQENRKAPGLAKAWNDGKLDQWIRVKHVEPALRKKRQHAETQKAAVLASAMSGVFTAELNDGRILRQLKIANNIGEEQIRTIAKSIKRRNPYRA